MRIGRLLQTLRYIKPIQIVYQLRNRLFRTASLQKYKDGKGYNPRPLNLLPLPARKSVAGSDLQFDFLNLSATFPVKIDWNYNSYGKLWNYNLQYLDYINQEDISEEIRLSWILDLYSSLDSGILILEPYPASLRVMNMMRFFSMDGSRIQRLWEIKSLLHAELTYLNDHYEYHILGNHLLENAFAMLMASSYFQSKVWKSKASKILIRQLNEQILKDGAHFELSPMYHQIILFRVLEAISYLKHEDTLSKFLRDKAELMLGWLNQISFSNGEIPHFNDSSDGIAYTVKQLQDFAVSLNLKSKEYPLSNSGYRKFANEQFELITDVHGISPDYQPGHNHADHLSFVLYAGQKPFIIDPGTSTYNISDRRNWERSTKAHNTVTVNNQDQSDVWSGFRVGRRAVVKIIKENSSEVLASVQYKGIRHVRNFAISQASVSITDLVNSDADAVARYYLHPSVFVSSASDNQVNFTNGFNIEFENILEFKIEEYDFAEGFNKLQKAKVIEAFFKTTCKSTFFSS